MGRVERKVKKQELNLILGGTLGVLNILCNYGSGRKLFECYTACDVKQKGVMRESGGGLRSTMKVVRNDHYIV